MNQETLKAKQAVVEEVKKSTAESKSVVFVEYRGLTVDELMQLRRELAKESATLSVYKNTLVSRALNENGIKDADQYLSGPNAFVFSSELTAGPKILVKFAKKHDALKVKAGIIDGKVVGADDVKTIATLPGREGLLSMFLSCLQAPISSFARTVKAVADAKA